MTTVHRIRVLRPRKPVEPTPTPPEYPIDPIVQDELGGWSIWHNADRFPSRTFAAAVAAKQERRHDHDCPFQE